jgi:hypothetical protein
MSRFHRILFAGSFVLCVATAGSTSAQPATAPKSSTEPRHSTNDTPTDVLTPEEWKRVDTAVNRALIWLAANQRPDGSFPTLDSGQPAVTCLCTMAFMAHGHMAGEGQYGKRLERATEYVINCQKANGLVTLVGPDDPEIARNVVHDIGETAAYNHAISSLMLSEVYGSSKGDRSAHLKKSISKSIAATLKMQRWPKERPIDRGGWRYLDDFNEQDSDLSITGWELMFLRSARNAGFDVPSESIDDAVGYVRRTFSDRYGAFGYIADKYDFRSRGMAGAGILALAHAGLHGSPEAVRSGDWLLRLNFDTYNGVERFTQKDWYNDRYHYGLFNCCQGMYQLGGKYWEEFYPRAVHTVLANQRPDGSWAPESHFHDAQFGNAYTTALVVLCLGAPNQLLPIFQR